MLGGEATPGYPSPPRALGHSREAHVRLMRRSRPPGGHRSHWCERQGGHQLPAAWGHGPRSASPGLSEKRPPVPEDSVPPRAGGGRGWGTRQAGLRKGVGEVGERLPFRLFWESRASAVSWCRQGPPASTRRARCQSQDVGVRVTSQPRGGGTDRGTG